VPRHWENHHTANNAVFVRHKSVGSGVRGCLSFSLARQLRKGWAYPVLRVNILLSIGFIRESSSR
jgi:hypothetical protein